MKTLAALCCALLMMLAFVNASADRKPFDLQRDGWSWDRHDIIWYAGHEPEKKSGAIDKLAGWAEYDFSVPATGWYELILKGTVSGWDRDVYLDGTRIFHDVNSPDDDIDKAGAFKQGNLALRAGKHVLRIRRLNFPGILPSSWELRSSDGSAAGALFAKVVGQKIVRAGESVVLDVTGGTTIATSYSLVERDVMSGAKRTAAQVSFPAGKGFQTKRVMLSGLHEGVFELRAQVNGAMLRHADLQPINYVVVDTKHASVPTATSPRSVVHDIDCVGQTDMGKAIVPGTDYWEANGQTRITTSQAGAYRETGDNADPAVKAFTSFGSKPLSAFSYRIDVPEPQRPYLLQVQYPDDDRRTANVIIIQHTSRDTNQPGGGYETGDWYPLTGKMQTYTAVFWPETKEIHVAIVSMNRNMRAAASHIKLIELGDSLPAGSANRADGRVYGCWYEEGSRWLLHFAATAPDNNDLALNSISLKRWIETCRFTGINCLWPTVSIYQGVSYPADEQEGLFVDVNDNVRLASLLCEKYRMRFVPELHMIPGNDWFQTRVMAKLGPKFDDLLARNRYGQTGVSGPYYSALDPAVQDKYIRIVGELADRIADTNAFSGISLRLMEWQWGSFNAYPGLNWGYEDRVVKQFVKDTGIRVPGKDGDPDRFAQRFAFLTAPHMRQRWMDWRCRKMFSYYIRLRDRIRLHNPTAVLYLPKHTNPSGGETMDEDFGSMTDTPLDQLREMGIDARLLAKTPGITFMPVAYYGRRNSSPTSDQQGIDPLLDPQHKALGMGQERAFGYGNSYFEVHQAISVDKLGFPDLKPTGYNGAADAGGRTELERLSVVLADNDAGTIMDGGFGYVYGQPEAFNEWLGEYKQLPRQPFTPLAKGRDPVAVWYRSCGDAFYFYAVNRESYSVPIDLILRGAKSVIDLATGDISRMTGDTLGVTLKPYQLVAFKTAANVTIADCAEHVPADRIEQVKNRLCACQELGNAITSGARRGDVTDQERAAYLYQLSIGWAAFGERHYWRARTALSTTPMISVFDKLASYPQGQLNRRLPDVLATQNLPLDQVQAAKMLTAGDIAANMPAGSQVTLVDSSTYDPNWQHTQVMKCGQGVQEFDAPVPVSGKYRLSIGIVAPSFNSISATINGSQLPMVVQITEANRPMRSVLPLVVLPEGFAHIKLQGQGAFGLYGITLQPVYEPLKAPDWSTIGPFPSTWMKLASDQRFDGKWVKQALAKPFIAEDKPIDLSAPQTGVDGKVLNWQQSDSLRGRFMDRGVNFLMRSGVMAKDVCYAVTYITSPTTRKAQLLIGVDWWANAYLNGQLIPSSREQKYIDDDGAQLNGHTPVELDVTLREGVNVLIVKCHGGSAGNYFTAAISDPGDLLVAPQPQQGR